MQLGSGLLFLVVCLIPVSVWAEFEDLSTDQIEDLLRTLEYEEEYRNEVGQEPFEYHDVEPSGDFYDNYDDELVETDLPAGQNPFEPRQPEILQHGTPLKAGQHPGTHPGALKANTAPKASSGPVLPAYCDPPNPCPIGYTAKDGCIEDFENSSEFSRNYQARQNCLCDSEHMFNCPVDHEAARKPAPEPSFLAGLPTTLDVENPFLSGTKLPIAAKKGLGF